MDNQFDFAIVDKIIEGYDKLNLEEAKKLYIKMINSNNKSKELYRDTLIKGICIFL